MRFVRQYLISGLACLSAGLVYSQDVWTSQHVRMDKKGSLTYFPDSLGNKLPDFSRVGYYQADLSLPDVKIVKTISAGEYNSQQIIQAAIDEVATMPLQKNGFRGTILLKKGVYKIPGTIKMTSSGIVLKGEGDATRLIATGTGQRSLISITGSGKLEEIQGSRQKISDKYVPVGAMSFSVTDAMSFKVGDSIVLFRPGTKQWISDLKMDQIQQRDSNTKQWKPKEYDLHFERLITRIEGNKIFIDNPVVMSMEEKYGGGEIYRYKYTGRISNIGVENLLCESEYSSNIDEDHGWNAIHVNRVQNSWIKNVTAIFFGYSCVNLASESRNVTVINCKSLDAKSKIEGGRRYSFNNDGQMNLFVNCYATEGRHDYVTGAQVRGPNVFYNCRAVRTHGDTGPHHRWAMGTLYDNIVSDGEINSQDRGNWGTGHGWSGVNQVFWNCTASKAAIQDPWVSGKNFVIGMHADPYEGRLSGRPASVWEGIDLPGLYPVSLYQAQLNSRVKKLK